MKAKISVIVPIYNAKPHLKICLDSLLNQTFNDFQVVLVDDGSTDGSGLIVERYMSKFAQRSIPHMIVHHDTNLGTLLARKTGIHYAIGDYTTFMDADDCFTLTTSLETMYREMAKRKVDILQFPCTVGDENDDAETRERVSKYVYKFKNEKQNSTEDIISSAFIFETISCFLWSKLFDTKLLKQASQYIAPIKMAYAEDTYLFLLISSFARSYEYAGDCEPVYFYRLNENGQSCRDKKLSKGDFYRNSYIPISYALDSFLEVNDDKPYIHQAVSIMKTRFMNHLSKKPSV